MRTELLTLNQERNVTLTAYLQETGGAFSYISKRPAILILSGGGYQYCSDREADPVAMPYLKAGYQVFILRYSVKKDAVWPNPLKDYEQAMTLIRSKREEWNVYGDRIAVLGFSAGGHLAGCAATMAENKPNAAILGYAVTRGEDVQMCESTAPDVISAVTEETCPCFVFATCNDQLVAVENSVNFLQALAQKGVTFESHIYAYGPHGFSTGDTSVQNREIPLCSRVPDWVEDSIGWLKDVLGDFGENTMTEPVCKAHVSGDYDTFLSWDCTFGYLRNYAGAETVMTPFLAWLEANKDMLAEKIGPAAQELVRKNGMEGLYFMADSRSFREILNHTGMTKAEKQQIEEALEKIPNER